MPDGGEFEVKAQQVETIIYARDRRKKGFTDQNRESVYVEVTVKDTGIGIKPDQLNIIFDPFFTTKPQGTGLGLSVSYMIVTSNHKGTLEVSSEVGKGSCFIIQLPLTRD